MSALTRANGWLLAITILLTAVLLLEPGIQYTTASPVTNIDTSLVQNITVLHNNKTHIILNRDGKAWQMLQPENATVASQRANKLLHIAELPSLQHFIVDAAQLSEFGLATPRYQLQLDDLIIRFGNTDPVTHLRYIQIGDQVHLITDSYTQYILASAQKWIDQ